MRRGRVVLIAVAVAELFGLLAFVAHTDDLERRNARLSQLAAFRNSRDFESKHSLQPDFDSCLWSSGQQTCTALKDGQAVKYHCDAERCNFDCGAAK